MMTTAPRRGVRPIDLTMFLHVEAGAVPVGDVLVDSAQERLTDRMVDVKGMIGARGRQHDGEGTRNRG
jgi:hypothetical protein